MPNTRIIVETGIFFDTFLLAKHLSNADGIIGAKIAVFVPLALTQ